MVNSTLALYGNSAFNVCLRYVRLFLFLLMRNPHMKISSPEISLRLILGHMLYFIKHQPNADTVQVKEQKAEKGLYIDNGPARRGGFTMDWRNVEDRAKPILLFHMLMAFVI
jgi:hypothetical protein